MCGMPKKGDGKKERTALLNSTSTNGNGHAMVAAPTNELATKLNLGLLKRLTETPGTSGREEQVRALVMSEMRPLVDEISVDAMGNVIGVKRGATKTKVMLAAHMDEIGFLVKHV